MAGMMIEQSREARRRDREAVQVKGTDGLTYTIYIDTEQLSAPKSEPNHNFAGIAEFTSLPSDPIPDDEYDGF